MSKPMNNRSQGFSEHNERTAQHVHIETSTAGTAAEQVALDRLMETGFDWEEAAKLLNLRDHLYENAEMRQRMDNDPRLQFVRWLYEHGEMSEM
jgi:hypothetical protein